MKLEDAAAKVLVIDRWRYLLTLYERDDSEVQFKATKSYTVAIGAEGFRTPRGLYIINTKSRHPDWRVPDSDWAIATGLPPGTVIPFEDPRNPIKERWLGVTEPEDGVGIHGTAATESLGTAASHGCIRMAPEDVIELFDLVPKGTPAVIL